jgi:hypothetical protein
MTRTSLRLAVALVIFIVGLVALMPQHSRADGEYPDKAGGRCGGFQGIGCPPGQWCEQAPGACGGADRLGICAPINAACTREFRPVCGCNGRTFPNDCVRRNAEVTKAHDGPCR